ncbi:uncharacterized protein LOC144436962 [Glandiceps talaboti]
MGMSVLTAPSIILLLGWICCPVQCEEGIVLTITHVSPTIILTSWQIAGVITGDVIIIMLNPSDGNTYPLSIDITKREHSFNGLFPDTEYTLSVSAYVNGRNSTAVQTRSTSVNPCHHNPCENDGTCQLVIGLYTAYSCYCTTCYTGEHCEYGPSACHSDPCQNGGVCSLKSGSCSEYECRCPSCFSGINCQIDDNACSSNPCPTFDDYNTTCEVNLDACEEYQCFCTNDVEGCFTGKDCEKRHNPCQPNPCLHGRCLPDELSCGHKCECPGCYTGDLCEELLDPCHPNPCAHGECVRDDRSCYQYTCICDDCYAGKLCDEPFDDTCSFYSPCRNNGTCETGSTCMDYECHCMECYEGRVCQSWHNPCYSDPCHNGGTCDPISGSCTAFNCTCPSCFEGLYCEMSIDACLSSPCKHGGTCTPSEDCLKYTCECGTWWIGPECSWNLVSLLVAGQVLFIGILIAVNIAVVCWRKKKKKKKKARQLKRRSRRYTVKQQTNAGYTVDVLSNGTVPSRTEIPENGHSNGEDATTISFGESFSSSEDDEEEQKEESEFKKGLTVITHDFCDNTTWHGLPNIGRSKSSASRLLWALVVLTACIAFIAQASIMVYRYFDYKVNIIMEETGVPSLYFPAVTICNTNKVRASALANSNHYSFVSLMQNIKVPGYYVPCLPGDNLCNNKIHCVKAYLVCDGMRNCPDGSDEFGCDFSNYVCGSDQFKCTKGGLDGVCIPIERQCDGTPDCNEAEDEKNCQKSDSSACDGFFCDGNFCHPYTDKCNYKEECADGYDEEGCKYRACQYWEYRCDNKKCIAMEKKCNWHDDCGDGSDEDKCEYAACSEEEFKCNSSGQCIPSWKVCNNFRDCPDSSDELQNCTDILYIQCIPSWKVCNNFRDCPDSSDELQNCTDILCIDNNERCEFWARNEECKQNPTYMKKYCPRSCKICTGEKVVPDENGDCPPQFFKCDSDMCIDEVLVCDTIGDCPNSEDEKWPNCIYEDNHKQQNVFHEGWWHKYSDLSKKELLFDNFVKHYFKDPGFDRVHREDPPDWTGFITFSSTPDFSDMQNVLQLDHKEIAEYGHQAEDFILQCSYNERPCNYSNFRVFQDKTYGSCYTFNHGTNGDVLRNATKSGAQYGLKLTLFTEQHEYLGIYGQESGVRVTIHDARYMPMPADNGLTAKTGAATSFAIRQTTYNRKGGKYSKCNNTDEPIHQQFQHFQYSTLACRHLCLQNLMQEYCGCMDVPFYGGGKCKILNKTQEACRQLMHYFQQNQDFSCGCLHPCDENLYTKTTSLASWPSESYLRQLLKNINVINPKTKRISDYESAQKNLAYIEVYYDSLSVQYVREDIAYTDDDLMSDLGGLLGLYIGVSVITVCELCAYIKSLGVLFFLSLRDCCSLKKTETNVSDDSQKDEGSIHEETRANSEADREMENPTQDNEDDTTAETENL